MYSTAYEITALIARYILILLCAIVLLRTIFIARASRTPIHLDDNSIIAKLIELSSNKEFLLTYDNTIGNSNRCDIQVEGRNITAIHAQIYKKQGNWMLCTYSKNNTLLNEIKIAGRIQINSNDVLSLGGTHFRFILTKGDDI